MKFPPTYGEQLRAARVELGMTQAKLAELLRVKVARVQAYERNTRMPDDENGRWIELMLYVPWPPQFMTYEQQCDVLEYLHTLLHAIEQQDMKKIESWARSARINLHNHFGESDANNT